MTMTGALTMMMKSLTFRLDLVMIYIELIG